jgi:hypothetical protein
MSLGTWARKVDGSLSVAMQRLKALPEVEHGVEPSMFTIGNKGTYHAARERAGFHGHLSKEIREAPIKTIPLAGLITIQRSVSPERVEQYLQNPEMRPAERRGETSETHGGPIDYPVVVQVAGKRYIHDGHHRLVAAKLSGDSSAPVRFLNLDL